MFLLFTRGRIALTFLVLLAFCLLLSEPLLTSYFVQKTPFGTYLGVKALRRSEDVGNNAVFLLLDGLTSENNLVVKTACQIAGRIKSKAAVPLLFKLVNISNPVITSESLKALKKITGQKSLKKQLSIENRNYMTALVRTSCNGGFSTRIAVSHLEECGIVAIPLISSYLEDNVSTKIPPVNLQPLFGLLADTGSGYRPELILSYLKKPLREPLRSSVIKSMSALGHGCLPYLATEINSFDYWRFDSAVEILYQVDQELAVMHFAELITDGVELTQAQRLKIYSFLGKSRMIEGVEALEQAVKFEADPNVQINAIDALGQISDEMVVPLLLKLTQSKNRDVRRAASKALYTNGTSRAHKAWADGCISNPSDAFFER